MCCWCWFLYNGVGDADAHADSDAYSMASHHSSHPAVVEELGVEVHSTSSLKKDVFGSSHLPKTTALTSWAKHSHAELNNIMSLSSVSESVIIVVKTWAAVERLNWSAVMAMEAAVGCKPENDCKKLWRWKWLSCGGTNPFGGCKLLLLRNRDSARPVEIVTFWTLLKMGYKARPVWKLLLF